MELDHPDAQQIYADLKEQKFEVKGQVMSRHEA